MLLLAHAVVALVASPRLTTPMPTHAALPSRVSVAPTMGLFDGFKNAFDNDERLMDERAREVNAGKSRKVPDYVKKKEQERARYEASRAGTNKEEDTGGSRMDELLSKWKW